MFQYTKETLKAHLQQWVEGNGADADETFIDDLDEIIQRGELRCMRDLDLSSFDYVLDTTTSGTVPEVFKPGELVAERLVVISVDGRKSQLQKRSRAFIEAMNRDGTYGTPKYYGEWDEDRWFLAPIPADAWIIYVHGEYRPVSLVDGDDANTTWLSTRFPDILAAACSIEAAQQLRNWGLMAVAQAVYEGKLDDVRGLTANLRRSDVGEIIGDRMVQRTPTVAPNPAASP